MSQRGFTDKAGEVEEQEEGITENGSFVSIGQAKPGSAFQVAAGLGCVAGFGVTLAAEAQFPGNGIDLHVTGQADLAAVRRNAGERQTDRCDVTEGVVWIVKRTEFTDRGSRKGLIVGDSHIRGCLVSAFQAADPFGDVASVVVTVAGQSVAVRAKRDTFAIEAAFEAGERIVITLVVPQGDGAQGMQVLMDVTQHIFDAFTSIAQDFANLESRKAAAQCVETRDGQQVVIDIGRGKRPGKRPDRRQAVIDDIEGFGFVAKVVFAGRGFGLSRISGGIGGVPGLVGARVIDISCIGITRGGKTAVLPASIGIAKTACFASFTGWTRTLGRRE